MEKSWIRSNPRSITDRKALGKLWSVVHRSYCAFWPWLWGQRASMVGQAMSACEQEPGRHCWPGETLSTQVLPVSCLGCSPNLRHLGQEGTRKMQGPRSTWADQGLAPEKGCRQERIFTHSVPPTVEMLGAHPAVHSRPHPLWTVGLLASAFRGSTHL